MHPTERGKVTTAAGLVIAARVMVTKRGNRIGICTLDDRSGRLEVMLFSEALEKYQHLLEKDRILIVSGQVSFDDFSGGLKMMAREVMDIDEAREKYARGLAISLTDRQIDDQLLNRLRQSLEPIVREPFQYISTIRGRMHVRGCVSVQPGVSLRAIVYLTICVASSVRSRWNWSLTNTGIL